MQKILAYGTLREHDYNFERIKQTFGKTSIVKLEELRLPGFKMYNLGFYPAVRESENTEDYIHVDLLEVSDEAAEAINTMEFGAGYKIKDVEGARLYIYGYALPSSCLIKSGNWFDRE